MEMQKCCQDVIEKILMWNTTLFTFCLIPRTTVTSLSAPRDKRCKTHPLCVHPGVPFERRRKTSVFVRSRIHADVTVVLKVRQSINHWCNKLLTCLKPARILAAEPCPDGVCVCSALTRTRSICSHWRPVSSHRTWCERHELQRKQIIIMIRKDSKITITATYSSFVVVSQYLQNWQCGAPHRRSKIHVLLMARFRWCTTNCMYVGKATLEQGSK